MKVVVIGERMRAEPNDEFIVDQLLDALRDVYADLVIGTGGCDRGIGKIVRQRVKFYETGVATEVASDKPKIEIVDFHFKTFVWDRPKAFFADVFDARNHALCHWGEEFHLFLDKKASTISNLYKMIEERGLPCSVYYPNELSGPKLHCKPISSSNRV